MRMLEGRPLWLRILVGLMVVVLVVWLALYLIALRRRNPSVAGVSTETTVVPTPTPVLIVPPTPTPVGSTLDEDNDVDITPAPTPAVIYGGGGHTFEPVSTIQPDLYTEQTDYYKGTFLGDAAGRSLYVYDGDRAGVSNCNGSCINTWIPFTPAISNPGYLPANITVIQRSDGKSQYAWFNKPLYYYAGDRVRGDMNGDGINGVWHLAPP